jgi:hypothetical protein
MGASRPSDRQPRLLASGGQTRMLPRGPTGPTRPLALADGLTTRVATYEQRYSPVDERGRTIGLLTLRGPAGA